MDLSTILSLWFGPNVRTNKHKEHNEWSEKEVKDDDRENFYQQKKYYISLLLKPVPFF